MAGCRGSLCCCCRWCCCCGERETRTPEELTILGETQEEEDEILPRKDYETISNMYRNGQNSILKPPGLRLSSHSAPA
uniref:Chloride voltage-gated channel 6 n=1 Tax=Molossus molossus TaxID=27622 RepID=A0A7J8F7H6_MOLMO|nr:chloride voltage-gated channel 6 [Molossus molossus]